MESYSTILEFKTEYTVDLPFPTIFLERNSMWWKGEDWLNKGFLFLMANIFLRFYHEPSTRTLQIDTALNCILHPQVGQTRQLGTVYVYLVGLDTRHTSTWNWKQITCQKQSSRVDWRKSAVGPLSYHSERQTQRPLRSPRITLTQLKKIPAAALLSPKCCSSSLCVGRKGEMYRWQMEEQ
jgi:hypothetical protein